MTYEISDVIIDRNDSRVREALGKECYTGKTAYEVLSFANNNEHVHILDEIHSKNFLPFKIKMKEHSLTSNYACLIIKKN